MTTATKRRLTDEEAIALLVRHAPPLTPEQLDAIATRLQPVERRSR